MRRNGRPYAVGIMPIVVASSAALAVGYGLGEQAQLGERDVQTVTQEVRRTGDVKRLSIVFTCDSEPIGLYEIERRLRTAGFKRPQAGSIMDAEQSDELAEAYEQGKQAVFDAMNHFDELAIVERANPYRKDGR